MPPMQGQKLDMLNNNKTAKSSLTDPLDDAMRELIDVCQQYNDKILNSRPQYRTTANNSSDPVTISPSNKPANSCPSSNNNNTLGGRPKTANNQTNPSTICDTKNCNGVEKLNLENISIRHNDDRKNNNSRTMSNNNKENITSDSIERLRLRQGELQTQLDEVLEIAKGLEARQKRKLKCILESDLDQQQTRHGQAGELVDEDDDELIEFQQIENELRISELNRQLSNIQEELRLRLYKQLLSKTKHGSIKPADSQQHDSSKPINTTESVRRDSIQTDTEAATPSYSSCSEEQATTASSATATTTASTNTSSYSVTTPDSFLKESASIASSIAATCQTAQQELTSNTLAAEKPSTASVEQSNYSQIDGLPGRQDKLDLSTNHEEAPQELTPTTSSDWIESSAPHQPVVNNVAQQSQYNLQAFDPATFNAIYSSNLNSLSSHRGPTSDLERIDEDDEDVEGYYGDSERFRSIYEEKLSPIIRARTCEEHNFKFTSHQTTSNDQQQFDSLTSVGSKDDRRRQDTDASTPDKADLRENIFANVNSSKRPQNRPLTLYLPKRDEKIDLHEHIQTLGHDLDILSNDLVINSTCARGYLYKSCSKNSKKWLKRYFFFDRDSKVLAYYENESQLVKKNCAPKNNIPFEEICDVYVDHKLSGIGEKELSSSKKKSFVFVLATLTRKYTLASSRAETMRAWIDILFTAARANDYSDQLTIDNENEFDFQDC